MPAGAHSQAACWVSAMMPALLAEYAAGPRPPRSPAALVTLTMAPCVPLAFMALHSWVHRRTRLRLAATRAHAARAEGGDVTAKATLHM